MISTGPSTRYFFGRNWLNRATTASFCAIMMALAVVAAGCGGSSSSHHTQPHHFSFSVSGGIWVANGSNVLKFTNSFTSRNPNIAPETIITNSAGFNSTQGVLFDSEGDLWVIDGGAIATSSTGDAFPALEEFTAAQIAGGGSLDLTPAVTITNTTDVTTTPFGFPQQAVFDSTGNMWVTDNSTGAVDVFLASQLTTSGDVTPQGQLTTTGTGGLNMPLGIAFDSSGNLWVANNGDTSIFEYDNAIVQTLIAGGVHDESPTVVLSDDGANSIQGPWALVFSTLGDLWSSNANTPFTVVAFGPDQLAVTGNPTPQVTFNPVNVKGVPSLSAPNGLAFDNFGNLAAANSAAPFSIAIFAADQLGGSGNTKPKVLISGSNTGLVAPAGDVIGPN